MLDLRKVFRRRDRAEDDHWFEFWVDDNEERFAPDLWTHIEPHVIVVPVADEAQPTESRD